MAIALRGLTKGGALCSGWFSLLGFTAGEKDLRSTFPGAGGRAGGHGGLGGLVHEGLLPGGGPFG